MLTYLYPNPLIVKTKKKTQTLMTSHSLSLHSSAILGVSKNSTKSSVVTMSRMPRKCKIHCTSKKAYEIKLYVIMSKWEKINGISILWKIILENCVKFHPYCLMTRNSILSYLIDGFSIENIDTFTFCQVSGFTTFYSIFL